MKSALREYHEGRFFYVTVLCCGIQTSMPHSFNSHSTARGLSAPDCALQHKIRLIFNPRNMDQITNN